MTKIFALCTAAIMAAAPLAATADDATVAGYNSLSLHDTFGPGMEWMHLSPGGEDLKDDGDRMERFDTKAEALAGSTPLVLGTSVLIAGVVFSVMSDSSSSSTTLVEE